MVCLCRLILVANTNEISQKALFNKYSEKVIDRTYYITERPEKVDLLVVRVGEYTDYRLEHYEKIFRMTLSDEANSHKIELYRMQLDIA